MNRSAIIVILIAIAVAVYAFGMHYRDFIPVAPIGNANESVYSSSDLDLSFRYPSSYTIETHQEGSAEREWHVLVFMPKNYIPPQGGEGPATITVSVYDNRERIPLETWIRGDARSNFKLSADGALTPVVVGGESGLSYKHSGLYETDAVAVEHDEHIYVFAAQWQAADDETRQQLQDLLKTVQFL
jgi:hypothetical protein